MLPYPFCPPQLLCIRNVPTHTYSMLNLSYFFQFMDFKAHVCDSNWRYCCIFHLESSFWQFVGVGKHNHLREWLQHSLYLRESALATDPPTHAPLPSGHPSPSSAHASCCVHGGCWEDSGAVTYQCTLPCFNTEQMNGLHAISLKEEDTTAEGWGCSVWAGGGGRSALSSADRAPSYMEEFIHVTGGCCHSAAHRHLTRCQFQVIKRTRGGGARSEGRRHRVFQALDYAWNYGFGGEQRAWLPAQTADLIRISKHHTCSTCPEHKGTGAQAHSCQRRGRRVCAHHQGFDPAGAPNICLPGFTAHPGHTVPHRFEFATNTNLYC